MTELANQISALKKGGDKTTPKAVLKNNYLYILYNIPHPTKLIIFLNLNLNLNS